MPFVVGVAGSVAVGKSTTSRVLRELLARWPHHPRVELVTTDGFLLPNAELERRGLLARKGFPESYDQRGLLRFLADGEVGQARRSRRRSTRTWSTTSCRASRVVVRSPDILIVEGLNVLQPPRPRADGRSRMSVSDYFDFSVYVDARDRRRPPVVRRAVPAAATHRVRRPGVVLPPVRRRCPTTRPARPRWRIWAEVNEPNLLQNIQPTRGRATLVLREGPGPRRTPGPAAQALSPLPAPGL